MQYDKYPVISTNAHRTYEFWSEGPNGSVRKIIYYQEIEGNLFNLAFGDWNEAEQKIDDRARTNNKDRNKVLTTVASTVLDFIKHYPDASVFVKGSTPGRTRLYQIGIVANWHEIDQSLIVEGFFNGVWQPIVKHRNYLAFLAHARQKM